jgi:hypothetical protein
VAHAVRNAWKANRHWVATGFLASTCLFLVLLFLIWRNERFGIEQSRATGLAATTTPWDIRSQWSARNTLPVSFSRQARSADYALRTLMKRAPR